MPCRDDYPDRGDQYLKEINSLSRMLCFVMESLSDDRQASLTRENSELNIWWTKHLLEDAARIQREQALKERLELAKRAKSKLTKKELEALRGDF